MRWGLFLGPSTSVQQFVERLNDLNRYLLYFPKEFPKQHDQDEIIEILDQAKAPEWHKAMVAANIDIFEMSYEESVSYFMHLENLEKIQRTNGPAPTLPVDNKEHVTSSLGKSRKFSNQWCHYCDKESHNTADCRIIAKDKQQKKLILKPKLFPERSLWLFFSKKLIQLKQLKPAKIAASKKRKVESLLLAENNLITSSDEDEG